MTRQEGFQALVMDLALQEETGTKIVKGQAIPLWKKEANLEDLMTMAHKWLKGKC